MATAVSFDAHCHLDQCGGPGEVAAAWTRGRAAGVEGLVLGGVDPAGWRSQDSLAAGRDGVWVTWGVHPWTVARDPEAGAALDLLERGLREGPAAIGLRAPPVGLGETGLDRSSRLPPESAEPQQAAFRRQVRLARAHDLPLVLHVVRDHERALGVLDDEGPLPAGGMVHAFSAPPEAARAWLDRGFHLSFGGALTWPSARRARASAAWVPLDRLLVETDAPDLVAEPFRSRGEKGEPAHLGAILAALSSIRTEDAGLLARRTAENARRLFRLPSLGTP